MQEEANRFPTRAEIIVTVFLIVIAVGYAISGVVWGNPWTAITSLLLVAWISLFWWISLKKPELRSYLTPMGFLILGAWQLLDYGEGRKSPGNSKPPSR